MATKIFNSIYFRKIVCNSYFFLYLVGVLLCLFLMIISNHQSTNCMETEINGYCGDVGFAAEASSKLLFIISSCFIGIKIIFVDMLTIIRKK
ncbi:MAG: hypothetical protein DK305_000873 [Chloroflexi bacterium]|jgi:hypothetical protein|nr:MAG: hypothetical protein DK305_000873 [Chloroflexota bacterium]